MRGRPPLLWIMFTVSVAGLIAGFGLCGHPGPQDEFGSFPGALLLLISIPATFGFGIALLAYKPPKDGGADR